jgi:hypothetical protein
MKLFPMLFNLVVVVGAIVAYDLLRGGSEATNTGEAATEISSASGAATPLPAVLDGTADEILAANHSRRIEALERLVAEGRSGSAAGSRVPGGSGSGPASAALVPALDPADIVHARNPVFHEDTLRTIDAYMAEIGRRKIEVRQRNRYMGTLGALKLESTPRQREALVEESLKFHQKARNLSNRAWSPDEAGRDARRAALQDLEREYVSLVQGLVPAADVKKILDSRIPRGMGFRTGTRSERGREDR